MKQQRELRVQKRLCVYQALPSLLRQLEYVASCPQTCGMNQTIDGQASTSREQNSQPVPVDHVDLGRQLSVSGHRHLEVLDLTGDPEAWRCPVCLDLLHKPCVLRCGHVMCFW